jgi:RecB family endonuclease NucS
MLYRIGKTGDKFDSIDPLPFSGLPLEKDLENLIAQNLWDVLFESSELMPIFQERSWQPEADIYALNKEGDVIIFELKRDQAGSDAVHQALRYCEKAARFTYNEQTLEKEREVRV